MTAPTRPAGVTVAMVLDELARGSPSSLDVELLAGKSGVERRDHQSLSAEDRAGAVGLRRRRQRRTRPGVRRERDAVPRVARRRGARTRRCARLYSPRHSRASSSPRGSAAAGAVGDCRPHRRAAAAHPSGTPDAMARLGSALDDLLAPRDHAARRADGHPRAGRAHARRERHRQERVRARPGRPRPSPGGRRRGRAALPRRVVRARHAARS